MSQTETNPTTDKEAEGTYEAPAVVYEGTIGTRAGSPIFERPSGDIFDSPGPSIFD